MKTKLRAHYRARRREFTSEAGRLAAPSLNANLRRLLGDLDPSVQVCAYHALPEEAPVDVDARWFVPRIDGPDLDFRRSADGATLSSGPLGIAEPAADAHPLDSTSPVVVVCPAVAVDWRGGRLGMGQAYYDRFFSRHPRCLRIGVVYHVQTSKDPLPADDWDQPLDWIVTEKMILRTSERSLCPWT